MRYNSVLDLHTHTVASGHAYCSLREMAKAASKKGLEVLGITEHAPAMPGTCHKYYFENLKIVPREMYGIQLLLGSEVNILDAQGTVDLAQRTLERMDVVIASLHMPCMKPGSKLENTESYLNVMKNPYVNIIGHPDDGRYEIDYEALVQGAKEYGKVLELNNHSMDPDCNRQNAVENDTVMLNLCKKYQVPVVMDSDAHFDLLIGEFDLARELLTKLDFPEELVLNAGNLGEQGGLAGAIFSGQTAYFARPKLKVDVLVGVGGPKPLVQALDLQDQIGITHFTTPFTLR